MLKKSKGKKSTKSGEPAVPTRLSRKEKRKQDRQAKKRVKQENFRKFVAEKKFRKSYTGGRFVRAPQDDSKKPKSDTKDHSTQLEKSLGDKMQDEILGVKKKQKELEKDMKKQRRRQLAEENEEEEKNIHKLEKLLKLNKRKNKSIPKSFSESGFDYILDVCDSSKVQAAVQAEMNLQESASEFEEDLAVVTGKGMVKKKKKKLVKSSKGKSTKRKEDETDTENDDMNGDDSDDESDDVPEEFSSKKGNSAIPKTKMKCSDKNGSLESLENALQDDDNTEDDYSDLSNEGSDGDFGDESSDDFDESGESQEDESSKPSKSNQLKKSDSAIKCKASGKDNKTKKKVSFDDSMLEEEEDGLDETGGSSDVERSELFKSNQLKKSDFALKRKASDKDGRTPKTRKTEKVNDSGSDEDCSTGSDDINDSGNDDNDDFSDDHSEGSDPDGDDEKKVKDKNEVHEDIYGRLRDKHGNIIKDTAVKYVPPHLRNQPVDDKKKAELEKLARTLKGLLNRLAENNMHSIANQIDEMYMRHSRHDMNTTLVRQYLNSLIAPVHTPERLVMEHAMLIAVLHANVGSEVGAFFLQHLGKRFDEMHAVPVEIENKELDNLILLLCHMYTFKIFDSVLLYDILGRLANKFTPKDVDLILVVLRSVGFSLRKDNPLALKDFILNVQKLANNAGDIKNDSRVRFMLDVLLSIKNNNVSKIPQYDTTHSEHLKKIIKPMFRKGNYVTEMKITLDELLKADERGKWWVVGSAWSGPAPQHDKPGTSSATANVNSFTQEILDLAKKQRMNTATRKNIFCILMTAEDYLDAFEKLLRLGLKGQPEQDIVHVLIHCLLSETRYNPYYSHIADQLCTSDRKHRMTIQYAAWDRFKELQTHSNHQVTNLAKFLAHLFIQNSLPLSMLKTLEFTEMNKPCVRLVRQILLSLLLHDDREALMAVFSRVAKPAKLHMFRESIRLFMHHFLLKNIKEEDTPDALKLKEAIIMAEQALMEFSDAT